MNTFLEMGGYGGFVWPSYAVAGVVMLAVIVITRHNQKARERELEMLQAAKGRRRPRRDKATPTTQQEHTTENVSDT